MPQTKKEFSEMVIKNFKIVEENIEILKGNIKDINENLLEIHKLLSKNMNKFRG